MKDLVAVRREPIRATALSTLSRLTAVHPDQPIRFGARTFQSVVEERFLPEIADSRGTSYRLAACLRLVGAPTCAEAARDAARGATRRVLSDVPTQQVVAVDAAEGSVFLSPPSSPTSTGRADDLARAGWTGTQLGARIQELGERWSLPALATLAIEWASVVEWRASRLRGTEARLVVDPDQLIVRVTGERLYGMARQDSVLEGLDLSGRDELAVPPAYRSVMQGGRGDEPATVLECVFRRDLGTGSGVTWAAVPTGPGRSFRSTWARFPEHLGTDSGGPGHPG